MIKYPIPEIIGTHRPCWCGSHDKHLYSNWDRWGQRLDTVICLTCGTMRLDPRMNFAQSIEYYGNQYARDDVHEVFESQRRQDARTYLARWLNGYVLDYGCGPGGKLAGRPNVWGYDVNSSHMAYAKSMGVEHLAMHYGPFDTIYLSHTLEHWVDPLEDLLMLVQKLTIDGTLIVEVPLIDRLLLGSRGIVGEVRFPHVWYFSVRSLDKLMKAIGFSRTYTDRLTLVVYHRTVSRTPARDLMLHAAIAMCSLPVMRKIAPLLNRVVGYIDTRGAGRINGL